MKRYTPLKTYIIAIICGIAVIGLSIYAFKWYQVYEEEQTRESYLVKTNTISMQIVDINNIDTILMEAPSDYFIYISYTKSKDVLSLEKKLKKVIDKYGVNDMIYYIDATNNRDSYIDKLNSLLKLDLKEAPAIIYVKDNIAKNSNIIQSNKKIITADDFEKLIKDNGIEKISQ
ncbi:MAG: hypothetical protein E7158_02745 [Firmicutes bacterium]|nr:hypothetical protein [Bacillota bacterium]